MPPPASALRGADGGGAHGHHGAGGFGVSPFVPGQHGLLGDSPFTAAACAAAAQFLASPFGLHSGGGAPGSRLRRAARRGSLGAAGASSSALADFLNSDLASPGLLHAHHALSGRHASVSPLGLATLSIMGLHSGAASAGGATPPLLYSQTQPSPYGVGGGGDGGLGGAASLRDAAASFGTLPTILRKRARFGGTPSSAMRAPGDALGGGAGGGAGGGGAFGAPSTGRSAGTAAAVRAAQASLAAAETSCPLSTRRLTASAVSAMLSSGAGIGTMMGSASPAASSPADLDLARALFASPPPSVRAGGPHSATRSTRAAAAAAAAAASAHGAAGDLAGLSSPFGAASFWGEAAAAAASYAAAAAAAGGGAGGDRGGIAAAAAAGAAAGGWQRSNARVSSIFRRDPYPRDPRAAAGGAGGGAGAGGAAAAASAKESDALEVMRRVEFAAADVYTQAEEVLARPSAAGGAGGRAGGATPGSAPRAAPSARRGAASMAFVDALRGARGGGGAHGGVGGHAAGGAAAGTPVGAALAGKLAFAGGGFSPYVPAGGGELMLSPDVCAAGDGLLTLSPSAYLLK
jgi:hypothetical protein